MQAYEYGILCATNDQAALVKNINTFFATQGWRPLYRKQPTGLRNPERPDLEPQYSPTTANSSNSLPDGILTSIPTRTSAEYCVFRSIRRPAGRYSSTIPAPLTPCADKS